MTFLILDLRAFPSHLFPEGACCITHFTITTCTCLSHSQPAPVFHTHHLHLSTFTHRASIKPLSTDVFWEFSNVHSKHFHACVSVWFNKPLHDYWSLQKHIVVNVSSLSKRTYFDFENRTRHDDVTAVWSHPTDRFRARSIDERDSRSRLRSLHCYGNSKRLGMYIENDGKDPSCRLAKERTS